jgi:CDGSH-type Zn-finger protein
MEPTISNEGFPRVAECEPAIVKVEAGKVYSWCSCGISEKQPFCDSKHKLIENIPFKSVKVIFDKEEEICFCQCKQTKTPPFCDDTHLTINKQ